MRYRFTLILIASLLLAAGTPVWAQDDTYLRHEVGAAVSLLVQDVPLIQDGVGGDFSYTYFLSPNFGIEGNVAAYTSDLNILSLLGFGYDSQFYTAGPRVVKRWRWISVHSHVLLGVNRVSIDPGGIFGPIAPAETKTSFAFIAGAGVDLNFTRQWSLRLLQADFVQADAAAGGLYDPAFRGSFLIGFSYRWGETETLQD